MKRVPAVLSDIDGVIYRGSQAIGGSKQVLSTLLNPIRINDWSTKIPFACLTNGGGVLESVRAKYLNNIVFGGNTGLSSSQMILCHSPLKALQQYKDSFVLVSGTGSVIDVCRAYGFKKAIHVNEVLAMCPKVMPLALLEFPQSKLDEAKDTFVKRMGHGINIEEIKFEAIMVMADVTNFEISLQVMSDVLMSCDGSISGQYRPKSSRQNVKFYLTNPDLVYACQSSNNRVSGQMPFILLLEQFLQQTYSMQLDVIKYGKPSILSFEYAKNVLDMQAHELEVEISKYYMIGDNPKGDIYGANLMGWESILVETGIYRPNDHLGVGETPKHHVKDMSAAPSLILQNQ